MRCGYSSSLCVRIIYGKKITLSFHDTTYKRTNTLDSKGFRFETVLVLREHCCLQEYKYKHNHKHVDKTQELDAVAVDI